MVEQQHEGRYQAQCRQEGVPGGVEESGGAHGEKDQPDVVGSGIGQQALQVGAAGRVQRTEQGRGATEDQDHQPPPHRTSAEEVVTDEDDAVDTEGHHGPRHERRHRARCFGMGLRQPDVEGHGTRLRPEANQCQHENEGSLPRRQMSGMDGDGGERLTARVGGQDQKTDQDGGGADMG